MSDPGLTLTVTLSPDDLKAVAQHVKGLLAEEQQPTGNEWLRGAQAIADHLGCPQTRLQPASRKPPAIPIEHEGRALLARRSDSTHGFAMEASAVTLRPIPLEVGSTHRQMGRHRWNGPPRGPESTRLGALGA